MKHVSRRDFSAGALALAAMGVTRPAKASGAFSIATLEAASSPVGTFNSLCPKMAILPSGKIVVGYLTSTNYPTQTAQNFRLDLLNPDFTLVTRLYEQVLPTNPPAVLATATGEVYVAYSDLVTGIVWVGFWSDPINHPTTRAWYQGPTQGQSGKFSAAWDETRRCLFYIGNQNQPIVRFEEGGAYTQIPIFTASPNAVLEYPSLQVNPDSRIDLAWVNIPANNPAGASPQYRGANYMTSGAGIMGQNYSGNSWGIGIQGGAIAIPTTPDSASTLYTSAEELTKNAFMSSFFADDAYAHFVLWENPGLAERGLANPNRAGMTYIRASRINGSIQFRRNPLRGDTLIPKYDGSGGSIITKRNGNLYIVCASGDRLISLVSPDDGVTWHDHQMFQDPSWTVAGWLNNNFIYTIGSVQPAFTFGSTDIIGTFSIVNESAQNWANLPGMPAAQTMAFRLTL